MANETTSSWGKLLEQIATPWDWAAAAAGGTIGGIVTVFSVGLDLGTSIAIGATTGVALRKSIAASLSRPNLRNRSRGLRALISENSTKLPEESPIRERLMDLERTLTREIDLWEARTISDLEFSQQIENVVKEYRKLTESDSSTLRLLTK